MLDDQSGVGRRKPVHRTVEERAAIVAETYIAKHMDGLKRFLDDGTIEMDNNLVERAIRPIALDRKNALFVGHDDGGRTWGRSASLIKTCKLNAVEPFAYLKATLEAIVEGHPAARIDQLTPWNFQKSALRRRQ